MARWFPISSRDVSPLLLTAAAAVVVAGLVVTGPGGGRAEAAAGGPFLAHQALYELKLVKSRGTNAINSARGRILYNFSGSACEGYTSEFRQVSELDNGEGKRTLSDLRSTSWEDGDGKSYRFKISTRMNDAASSPVDGMAERSGDQITVRLKQPEAKTFTLDGTTVFPTEQIQRIIAAAREGKSLLQIAVYDGSDNGQKLYDTLTVIGKPIAPNQAKPTDAVAGQAAFATLTRWPVTISYFDRAAGEKTGEQTPVYAITLELYENGVSRALMLDYGNFVLSGEMTSIEMKDTKPCK
jgi:hypothetical protein